MFFLFTLFENNAELVLEAWELDAFVLFDYPDLLEFPFEDSTWVIVSFKLPLFENNDELMLEACELAFALED